MLGTTTCFSIATGRGSAACHSTALGYYDYDSANRTRLYGSLCPGVDGRLHSVNSVHILAQDGGRLQLSSIP
ncbi:hypothetical protein E2562_016499 [Oryza meyeriana var. granulata]|uniref:Uncharacterized protein n=1 Tax=Oryza meyeriana var. granulata TaxID=110450 RepID=A0A6G1BMT3_9ORYZ|nr:hypothetical protein E2562_016499 [Oryza meyeriana var. granulata]